MRRTAVSLTACCILTLAAASAAPLAAQTPAEDADAPAAEAPAPAPEPVAPDDVARAFVERLLAGEVDAAAALGTQQMKDALSPMTAEQLRGALVARFGPLRSIGDGWREDTLGTLTRWRVPLEFENGMLDLRVPIDDAGQVTGVFVAEHLDPEAVRAAATAAPSSGRQVDVQVGEGDGALGGTLTLPDGDGPFAAVVLLHGSGPNDRDGTIGQNRPLRDLAWGLAARGVASLRYDKRSKVHPQSLAVLPDMTVEQEVLADARAALALAAARPEIDAARVYVAGHSQGGLLAPRVAATADPPPAGVIVLAGPTRPLPELLLEQTRYIAGLDDDVSSEEAQGIAGLEAQVAALRAALAGETDPPTAPLLGVPFSYWQDLDRYDAPAVAASLDEPILVAQFGRDYQVTDDDFAGWKAALGETSRACLVRYAALDHLMRAGEGRSTPASYEQAAPVDETLIADLAAWIEDGACPDPTSR